MRSLRRFILKTLKKHRELLPLKYQRKYFKCVTIKPKDNPVKGRVLLSYALTSAGMPENHSVFDHHSCPWMSNKILALFNEFGYIVDCIHFTNRHFIPEKKYDFIFSLGFDILRLAAFAPHNGEIIKIWHAGTSSIAYNNAAEMKRITNLEKRHPGALYFPKRQGSLERVEDEVIKLADHVLLIGNDHVLNTFPKKFHHKFSKITVAATPSYVKRIEEFAPQEKEFIWHFGDGAVHKGLDLLLDVFAKKYNYMYPYSIDSYVEKKQYI